MTEKFDRGLFRKTQKKFIVPVLVMQDNIHFCCFHIFLLRSNQHYLPTCEDRKKITQWYGKNFKIITSLVSHEKLYMHHFLNKFIVNATHSNSKRAFF